MIMKPNSTTKLVTCIEINAPGISSKIQAQCQCNLC